MPALYELPRWLFASDPEWKPGFLKARWLFLRALGVIFFSAFLSLLFQIRGLIGPEGILPAADYLPRVAQYFGALRFWFAPTLLWRAAGGLLDRNRRLGAAHAKSLATPHHVCLPGRVSFLR